MTGVGERGNAVRRRSVVMGAVLVRCLSAGPGEGSLLRQEHGLIDSSMRGLGVASHGRDDDFNDFKRHLLHACNDTRTLLMRG